VSKKKEPAKVNGGDDKKPKKNRRRKKADDDEPISLYPLTVEEALRESMKVPWPPPDEDD